MTPAIERQLAAITDQDTAKRVRRHLTMLLAKGCAIETTVAQRARWLRYADDRLPQGIDRACEDEIVDYTSDLNWSDETRAAAHKHLAGYYRWATRRGYLEFDPMAELQCPEVPKRDPEAPCTGAQLIAALAAPRPWRTAVLLAWRAGLRISEVAGARREHVDDGRRLLRVRGKGGKVRTIPVDEMLWTEIADLPDGPLVPCRDGRPMTGARLTHDQRDLWARLGLGRDMHWHRLRHTFAQQLLDGGADIRVVQELMGHASLATTQRYLVATDARKRAAVDALPVLGHGLDDGQPVTQTA